MKKKILIPILAASIALSACATISSISSRHDTANTIAAKANMTERVMTADKFNLTSWLRLARPEMPVNVYIEGDGLAWLNTRTPSLNPTPPDPIALRLAAADTTENVVYFARPCQYSGLAAGGACPDTYWTNGRTAPDVILAYNQALDQLKAQYHVVNFNLIGYSGGAAVAALVAAGRSDVLSLRTVAGNIDYAAFTAYHHVSPLDASRDPIEVAPQLAKLPQYHFVGGDDQIIPPSIVTAWKQASGNSLCVQSTVVPGIAHDSGWTAQWQQLLRLPLPCMPPVAAAPGVTPAVPMPAPAAPAPATAPLSGPPPLGTL